VKEIFAGTVTRLRQAEVMDYVGFTVIASNFGGNYS
jgi:hypothetical protein